MTSKQRLAEIERCKGAAILLVVFGHLIARGSVPGYEWYSYLKEAIYSFHMPLFMVLSGYVYFLSRSHERGGTAWPRFVGRRALRLLVPFLVVGLLIVAGKLLLKPLIMIDQPSESLLDGVGSLFFHTSDSPALSIWYIWVLFWYSVLTPLIWPLIGRWLFWLLPAWLALSLVEAPDILYLDRIVRYFPYFVAGGWAAMHAETVKAWARKLWAPLLPFFCASLFLNFVNLPQDVRLIVCGLLSLPVFYGLMLSPALHDDKVLYWLGANSFIIYLLNTAFIGLIKGVATEVVPFGGPALAVLLPIMFIGGVAGPLLLRRWVLRYCSPAYELTR